MAKWRKRTSVTVSISTQVATRTDSTSTLPLSVSVITGPTIRRMRFVLSRPAGGTANGRGAGYKVQKKATGSLVVDGTITGTLLAAAGIITGTAQISDAIITGAKIGNLQVDTLQIANRAVTVPEFAIITSSAAVTITSTSIWKNVLSVTINRTGIDTRIAFNGQFDAVAGSTDVQLRVRRNGTAFGSTFDIGLSTRQSISFTTLDTDTGTGATTYDVDVILITAGNARMYQRFVEAIQFKK